MIVKPVVAVFGMRVKRAHARLHLAEHQNTLEKPPTSFDSTVL